LCLEEREDGQGGGEKGGVGRGRGRKRRGVREDRSETTDGVRGTDDV
jgi:hypothetical protein